MIKRGCQTAKFNPDCVLSHTWNGGEVMTTVIAKSVAELKVLALRQVIRAGSVHVPQRCFGGSLECGVSHDNKLFRMCKVHFKLEMPFSKKVPQPMTEKTFTHFQFMTIASSSVHWI